MAEAEKEGFSKRGTTLEGRVAQLFRLMGYDASRNEIIEGHEIDVYAVKNDEKIIVECKEYYTQSISRELILIFASKVRDINPTEAWFVTINDFDTSALELCKRYNIRAVNGYELEEYEDRAILNKGEVNFGTIPKEDRYLRQLSRRQTELSRERRVIDEIRKTVEQISSLRKRQIDLPPFLFPISEGDLEDTYIWLSDLENLPYSIEEGKVENIVVNLRGTPIVKGFKVSKIESTNLLPIVVIILFAISSILYYDQWSSAQAAGLSLDYYIWLIYYIPSVLISVLLYDNRKRFVRERISHRIRRYLDAQIIGGILSFQEESNTLDEDMLDVNSSLLYDLKVSLLDGNYLGNSSNFIVRKDNGLIQGFEVKLDNNIMNEVGESSVIVPSSNADFSEVSKRCIKVNALYVLSEEFSRGEKLI